MRRDPESAKAGTSSTTSRASPASGYGDGGMSSAM
jgi:hypothetical protein